jgi:hypothetical protein
MGLGSTGNSLPPVPRGPTTPDVAIRTIRVGDLEAYARDFFANPVSGATAPITPERARSLARNPHARPADPALVIAHQGPRCVGFQQVFPGALRCTDETARVFWFCGGYVVPEMRNRGIFARLVKALQREGGDLVSTAYSEGVARTLKRSGFLELGPLPHVVVYLRKAHLGRRTGVAAFKQIADLRPWTAQRIACLMTSRITTPLKSRTIEQVTDLPGGSRLGNEGLPRFDRAASVVNWMLAHPWVRDDAPPVSPEFHFVDRRQVFRYECVEFVSADGQVRGFVVASYQKTSGVARWTMLDHQVDDPALLANLLAWQWGRVVEIGDVDEVLLPASAWRWIQSSPWLKRLSFLHQRPYLAHPASTSSPLARCLGQLQLQFVDCDSSFS